MAEDSLDGVDLDASRDLKGAAVGTWTRRAILALLLVGLVFALSNAFGQRPDTTVARGDAAVLSVQSPARVRGGLVYQTQIDVVAKRAIKKPTLVFDSGWFHSLTVNAQVPQPSQQGSRDGRPSFTFASLRPGQRLRLFMYFQVNPDNYGRQHQDLLLDDGTTPLVAIDRDVTIFP